MTSLPLLVVLLLGVCCPLGDAQRQSLSDIRYRFTPCGATGRSGPGLLECFSFYREQGSPIQRAIISTFNAYPGSQRLEVPRSAVYNVTIAGASGGRGVCNIQTGKGLKFEFQTTLTDDTDLLIIVGQKGIGPCETDSDQINCLTPPDTLSSASDCASVWEDWLFSNFPDVSTDVVGGASGGGASVIFLFDRNSVTLISPLSVAGGGGGSSAELNLACDFLEDRGITPLNCTRTKEYFQCFLNASEEVLIDPSIEDGSRGDRIENGFVSGGAGGGLFPDPPSVAFDGASLNLDTQTEHAVGGFDCVQQLAGTSPFLNVNGGFGGGGGGCGGGGGGGGFHGGDVFETFNYIPGGGGTSAVFNTSVESVESNDGDGFVDIVPADCNCAYQCLVDKETDEFQCRCPDSTFLAPDQFDCFREFQQNVTEATALEPFITGRGVNIQAYTIDQAVLLYSMQATLTNEEDETCAIVLFGGEGDDLRVITSRPVNSGSRTVNEVAELNAPTLSYNVFLPDPLYVTGAALVSTGRCVIGGNVVNMDVSINLGVEGPPIGSGQFMGVVEFIDEFAESILQRRFCPSNTFLTPTGNDCYQHFVQQLIQVFQPIPITGGVNFQAYMISQEVDLYSMEATLIVEPGEPCAIVFIGGADDDTTFLVSEPLRENGTVKTVARLSAVSLNYFEFLPTSAHVGGIGVLSTGSCSISANTVVMNVSTVLGTEDTAINLPQVLSVVGRVNGTTAALTILQIQPEEAGASTETGVIVGVVVAAILLLLLAGIAITLIVLLRNRAKRFGATKANRNNDLLFASPNRLEPLLSTHSADLTNPHSDNDVEVHISQSLTLNFNAAYLTQKDDDAAKHTNEAVGFGKEAVSENSDRSAVTEEQAQTVDNVVTVSSQFTTKISASFNIPRCSLNITGELGQGEFGIVYRAVMDSKHVVAVKTVKGIHSQEMVDSMLQECAKMQRFRHPNVMPLIGVCLDGGPTPLIVMPYMVNGSLLDYLRKERASLVHTPARDSDAEERVFLAQKQMVDICLQVAKGMEYLASKKIVHRDLAARNCMINFNFVIKVADFGLAESIYSKTYFRRDDQRKKSEKLPLKWLAPECIEDGVFTEKTDVWSFGVTCWEVFSGGIQPYPGFDPRSLYEFLRNGHRMNKPDNAACSDDMYAIMAMCWDSDPKQRPDFSRLIRAISNSLEATTDYLKLTLEESMTTVKSPFVDKVDQRFIVPRCCLDMTDIPIGTAGSFGETFKATVRKNEDVVEIVAVKVIDDGADSQEVVDAVLKESAKMQRFRHPNVMPLIGVCLDGGPAPLNVMPYMANGSLLDYLRKERASLVHNTTANQELITLAELRMMDMCLQVAMGMEYLVSNSIVHRGLAARNCMIDYNFVIKVSDFSLSENMYSKAYFRPDHHKSHLPLKWLAPDVLNNRIFSEKTDIWAYGVTCWEVFSGGEVPYRGVEARSLLPLLQQGHRLEKPANAACSDYAYSMMKQCWLATPEERPTFSELVTSTAPLLRTSSVYNREELETATL